MMEDVGKREDRVEVLLHEASDSLSLEEVIVYRVGTETVRSQEDATPDFSGESVVACRREQRLRGRSGCG